MNELSEVYYPPTILQLTKEREDLGLREFDFNQVCVGSQDLRMQQQSLQRLMQEPEARSVNEVKNTPAIDIVEQFSEYSEDEIKLLLRNAIGIQLTEGCNGKCPFCFLARKGKERGVAAHYSFSS